MIEALGLEMAAIKKSGGSILIELIAGTVVSLKDGILVVALEEDLGPKLARVRLIADDSFLVQRLKDRLGEVQSGEAQFNAASADREIGQGEIQACSADIADELLPANLC
ncbi:MAG TPA: hypothetical protein PKN33_08590 [Phycisphaerae bacterium]|nr:hypothetical protein [Phycisphaerae bacterium]